MSKNETRGDPVDLDVWEMLFDWVYASAHDEHAGWQDSFLDAALPVEHMREWRDATVACVTALRGQRILEIGCGTGMVLSGVAASCEAYIATDLSAGALSFIADRYQGLGDRLEMHHLPAHQAVALVDERRVDVVVLNSVVQYFPDELYLRTVLDQALRRLRPGGKVFVGDVRDLRLELLFGEALRLRGSKGTAVRSELLVAPHLFSRLGGAGDDRYSAQVRVKRGQQWNEMNAFRYDVVLTKRDTVLAGESGAPAVWEWGTDVTDIDDVVRFIRRAGPHGVRVTNIPNARLSPHALSTGTLPHADDHASGVNPEACWQAVEGTTTAEVVLRPSGSKIDGFDVLVGAEAQEYRASDNPGGPLTRRL